MCFPLATLFVTQRARPRVDVLAALAGRAGALRQIRRSLGRLRSSPRELRCPSPATVNAIVRIGKGTMIDNNIQYNP
jgi:hypothetical protein